MFGHEFDDIPRVLKYDMEIENYDKIYVFIIYLKDNKKRMMLYDA
jgi:hypothetical protein